MSGQTVDTRGRFGEALDRAINDRLWTNEEAARALRVPERQIRRWRKAEREPRRDSFLRICDELDLEVEVDGWKTAA